MNYQTYSKFFKAIAAGIVILAVSACSEDGDTATAPSADPEVVKAQEAEALAEATKLAEAADGEGTWGDIVYGDPNAPVEVIEYASLTCPHCASFAVNIFPKIKEEYIDTGKVKFIYRNFVMNRFDMAASVVARCKTPEVTKKLMGVFFARQAAWVGAEDRVGALANLARRAGGMSRTEFDRCVANQEMQKHLVKMGQDGAIRYNVNATPTIIVAGDSVEIATWENIKAAIDAEL